MNYVPLIFLFVILTWRCLLSGMEGEVDRFFETRKKRGRYFYFKNILAYCLDSLLIIKCTPWATSIVEATKTEGIVYFSE
jgi:hypothetical protein